MGDVAKCDVGSYFSDVRRTTGAVAAGYSSAGALLTSRELSHLKLENLLELLHCDTNMSTGVYSIKESLKVQRAKLQFHAITI